MRGGDDFDALEAASERGAREDREGGVGDVGGEVRNVENESGVGLYSTSSADSEGPSRRRVGKLKKRATAR